MKTEIKTAFLIMSFALMGFLLSSGCIDRTDEQADADCGDAFCIGLLLPSEESDFYDSGKPLIRAAELARDDINQAGGNVRLILRNSDDPLPAAIDLLEAGVHGIVGPDWSGGVLEIFDFLVDNSTVAVSPSATSVTLTEKNKALSDAGEQIFFFRTTASDIFQAKILADQAEGEILIIHRDDDYGRNLTRLINENLEDDGRSEATVVEYAHDAEDSDEEARGVVDRIEALSEIGSIDSIIIIAFAEKGGKIIKGMLDSQVVPSEAQYYVSDGLASASLYTHVDEADPGVVAGFKAVSPTGLPNPPERKTEFEDRFDRNEFPSFQFTTHTYDAVVAMALASLSAESMDPSQYVSEMANVTRGATPCISYAQCAAALGDETTANDDINYEGLSGPIELDENGDIEIGFYLVYTYDETGKRDRRIFSIPDLEDVTPGQMP